MIKNQQMKEYHPVTPQELLNMISVEFQMVLYENQSLLNIVDEWAKIAEEVGLDIVDIKPYILKDMVCQLHNDLYQARHHLYSIGDN